MVKRKRKSAKQQTAVFHTRGTGAINSEVPTGDVVHEKQFAGFDIYEMSELIRVHTAKLSGEIRYELWNGTCHINFEVPGREILMSLLGEYNELFEKYEIRATETINVHVSPSYGVKYCVYFVIPGPIKSNMFHG